MKKLDLFLNILTIFAIFVLPPVVLGLAAFGLRPVLLIILGIAFIAIRDIKSDREPFHGIAPETETIEDKFKQC